MPENEKIDGVPEDSLDDEPDVDAPKAAPRLRVVGKSTGEH